MNLSTTLCGINFKNPVIAASGTFGYGREMAEYINISQLGGVASKAVTLSRREGNPPPRIVETASGCLNAVGLQNPGVDDFIRTELPFMNSLDTRVIVNVSGATEEEYLCVLEKLSDQKIDMIEINISCPNVKQGAMAFGTTPNGAFEITKNCRTVCNKPMVVKLTPNVSNIAEIAIAVEQGGADGISLINTLTGVAVNARTRKPILANITGGLSGPAVKPVALHMVRQVYQAVSIPIIGMGGIMTGEDVVEFLLCGARAVMIGTANLVSPSACVRIIYELEQFMEEEGIKDISELVGMLKI